MEGDTLSNPFAIEEERVDGLNQFEPWFYIKEKVG